MGVRVVGHRGAAAHAPENTIASLARGQNDGADEVEFDVQRTADGVPVLLHDDTLDRTTSGSGPLRARTWRELGALDAGSWFAPRFAGERIPSLADVCAWAKTARVDLSVELKQPAPAEGLPLDDGLAASAVECLRASGVLSRAVLTSVCAPPFSTAGPTSSNRWRSRGPFPGSPRSTFAGTGYRVSCAAPRMQRA